MRPLVSILGRTLFFSKLLFAPQGIRVFPRKSCMISIPVGSSWMSPLVRRISEVIINYKLIATQASPDKNEVAEGNLKVILAAIENSPRSSEEICAAYVDKLCNAGSHSVAARLLRSLQNRNFFPGPNAYNFVLAAAGK